MTRHHFAGGLKMKRFPLLLVIMAIVGTLTLVQNAEAQRCEESVTGSVCEDVGLACSPPSGGSCRQVTNNAGNPAGCVCSALAANYYIVSEEPHIVSEEPQPKSHQEFFSIHQQPPVYPQAALRRGSEGYVLLEFNVDESGFVREPRIIEMQGHPNFEEAALSAITKFRYLPRMIDGEPIMVTGVQIKITFEITD